MEGHHCRDGTPAGQMLQQQGATRAPDFPSRSPLTPPPPLLKYRLCRGANVAMGKSRMAPQKGGRRLPWTRSRPKYVGQVGTDFAELSGIKPTRLEQLPDESSATPSENEEMEEEKPVGVGGPSVRRCPRPQSASQHVGQPGSECVQAEWSLVRALPPFVPGCS